MLTKDPVTVGRKVWYWNEPYQGDVLDQKQPFDATVVFVNADNTINLLVLDHMGHNISVMSVELHDPDIAPETGEGDMHGNAKGYATWMPYQKKQHEKQKEQA